MKLQEANKLIAEFMGHHPVEDRYHTSWDALMPVITKLKVQATEVDHDWVDEEAQHIIDDIDDALTCCYGIDEVHRCTVEAIVNYNKWKDGK